MVFARIRIEDGREVWSRLQFTEEQPEAAKAAAQMLRTNDVREICTIPSAEIRYWKPEMQVEEL